MPYCFLGSSIKCQGHTGWKIDDLNPIWVRLLGRSQLSNPSDLPCLWEFVVVRVRFFRCSRMYQFMVSILSGSCVGLIYYVLWVSPIVIVGFHVINVFLEISVLKAISTWSKELAVWLYDTNRHQPASYDINRHKPTPTVMKTGTTDIIGIKLAI